MGLLTTSFFVSVYLLGLITIAVGKLFYNQFPQHFVSCPLSVNPPSKVFSSVILNFSTCFKLFILIVSLVAVVCTC